MLLYDGLWYVLGQVWVTSTQFKNISVHGHLNIMFV